MTIKVSLTVFTFLFSFCLSVISQEIKPAFHLTFDAQDAVAKIDGEKKQEPLLQQNLSYVDGINGSAVYFKRVEKAAGNQGPQLKFSGKGLFSSKSGTVSFWVKPDWDGLDLRNEKGNLKTYRFFSAFAPPSDVEGKKAPQRRIWFWMWNWLRCDLNSAEEKPGPNLQWKCRNSWMKGDWWHVAITWNESDGRQIYVNGVPVYRTGKVSLDDISEFFIGGEAFYHPVESAFDEFKIFRQQLSQQQINAQFREFAPIDYTLERRFLRAGEKEEISLNVSAPTSKTVSGKLNLEVIADDGGKTVASWSDDGSIKDRETITIPLSNLTVGNYRLKCVAETKSGTWQRSFPLTVYQQKEVPRISADEVKTDKCLVDVDLTKKENNFRENVPSTVKEVPGVGKYVEAGGKKWDRIAVELPEFKAARSPLLLEIEWPDDKERAMSFYMFVASERKQHRERLSGGVQCGGEFVSSGKMRKTRYLFYPETDKYLFEVRTLIDGLPAAVSRLKIYSLAERLPKLPIELPDGMPSRNFGHLDEDQSFEILMSPHSKSPLNFGYAIQVMENLLDYNDYTGQNTMSYPVMRYWWNHLDTAPVNNVGSGLRPAGFINLFMDMMERRGQSFFPSINLSTVPYDYEVSLKQREEWIEKGQFLFDKNGKPVVYGSGFSFGSNPVHPLIREKFLAQINEVAQRFGKHSAFKGINLWLHTPGLFKSLSHGYGDFTLAVFEKETGIKVPVKTSDPKRFAKRYEFLTGSKKKEWLAWRAKTNSELLKQLSSIVQNGKKGASLYLNMQTSWEQARSSKEKSVEGFNLKSYCYEECALDLDALDGIDYLSVAPMNIPTLSRSDKHWHHGVQNLNHELVTNTELYRPFRNAGRGVGSLYYTYVESFMDSLYPEKYASYFQNSDPKAAGRNFLTDYAISMAAQNPETIFSGAQPLGTMGREEVSREFIRNFRALPAGKYQDLSEMLDPVTARFLRTEKGTYFYQVNLLPWVVETEISFREEISKVRDLGAATDVQVKGGQLKQSLKPYQLRAYFIAGKNSDPNKGSVTIDDSTKKWFTAKHQEIVKAVDYLKKWNGEYALAEKTKEKISQQIEVGNFSDAYRRINFRAIRVLPQLLREAVKTKTFFTDDFTDPKYGNWDIKPGFAEVDNGKFIFATEKSGFAKLKTEAVGDMIAEVTVTAKSDGKGWGGIIFKGAKLLLRKDGFWAIYRVNGEDKTKGHLVKVDVKPGKDYRFKILRRGNMSIFYVDGEKVVVANEPKGLQENGGGLTIGSTKYPVAFKKLKLSRILKVE